MAMNVVEFRFSRNWSRTNRLRPQQDESLRTWTHNSQQCIRFRGRYDDLLTRQSAESQQ